MTQPWSLQSGGVVAGQASVMLDVQCCGVPSLALLIIKSFNEALSVIFVAWDVGLKELPLVSW